MLSLMWSEHCGYKHTRKLLRRLPKDGEHVLLGPGENAGVVDVGGGLALAFKVESHNHPSAVEPFQGAATGIGGILRDVFAVGARPIAILDSLRFGQAAQSARSRYLLEHAVAGIGHYGNSIGVPTVGGEIYFEPSYEQNCLINAMCLGLAPNQRLIRSAAAGAGNALVLLGALTGRDGIGGASVLASAELGQGDEDKRPSVQIGDPFTEKKLLECCLELLEGELLVSLQDLGAAGLTSSASEMASKGAVGLDIDVSQVPLREAGMEPFEIMISESQERMLCVVDPERIDRVREVCQRWEVLATRIGSVTSADTLRVLDREVVVAELPVAVMVDDCPLYDLEPSRQQDELYPPPPSVLAGEETAGEMLLALLGSLNIASRRAVFKQYDPVVQSRTVRRPEEADAAVLSLPDGSAIAVSIDGNGRRVACDPRAGAAEAVYECAANLACVGAAPLALTNCLNFGNPEKPHVAWQLSEVVEGIAHACEELGIPVVGGNVSLYNEAPAGPILPTPVIGLVGKLPKAFRAGRIGFLAEGDAIALAGPFPARLEASELAKLLGRALAGALPPMDGQAVRDAHQEVRDRVRSGALHNAHDIAEGGIAVALAECCIAGGIGATVQLPESLAPFAEAPGQGFLVSGPESALRGWRIIGHVGGDRLRIEGPAPAARSALAHAASAPAPIVLLDLAVSELTESWERGLAGLV